MKCPGQDTQFWNASAIFEAACPKCGTIVEFFKDDTTRKCRSCGHRFVNPKMDFGCAAYCSFAEQCLGDLPPELVAQKEDLLKDRVAVAVKRHLKSDFKSIGRAARRARHAEQICKAQQGNLAAVLIAAYLWDLDAPTTSADELPIARALLTQLKAPEPLIAKVSHILARQDGTHGDAGMLAMVVDAAQITDMEDMLKENSLTRPLIEERIQSALHTPSSKTYAGKMLLG